LQELDQGAVGVSTGSYFCQPRIAGLRWGKELHPLTAKVLVVFGKIPGCQAVSPFLSTILEDTLVLGHKKELGAGCKPDQSE
jgi:hypothetical protein